MTDEAQPVEGQDQGGGSDLFDSYLQNVPEDGREVVSQYLKDAAKNVDSRLEEAANLKKTLGPYQEILAGSSYQPEQLGEVLSWLDQMQDPDAYKQWLQAAAQEAGLTLKEAEEAIEEEQGEPSLADIQKMIAEEAEQRTAPLQQAMAEWETQREIDSTEQEILKEFADIESEENVKLSDDQKAVILDLGMNHEGEGSWVREGFKRFQGIHSEGQRAFVEGKAAQPQTPVTAGGHEAFKPTVDFKEAEKQALARLRQMTSG